MYFACREAQEGLQLFTQEISQYFANLAEVALKHVVLPLPRTRGTERLSNWPGVTWGATGRRILKSSHLNIESYFTSSSL